MKARDIKGLRVGVPDSTAGDGSVGDLILDMTERTVQALQVLWSTTNSEFAIRTDDITGIDGGVQLQPGATPVPLSDLPDLLPLPTVNKILGQDVNAEDGQLLGKVADVDIDPASWQITAFDVVGDYEEAFRDGAQSIPVSHVLTGERSLTVLRRRD